MSYREKIKSSDDTKSLQMDIVDLHSLANIDRQQCVCTSDHLPVLRNLAATAQLSTAVPLRCTAQLC